MTLDMIDRVLELHNQGLAYWHISEKMKVSPRVVANYIRTIKRHKAGLPPLAGDSCNKALLNQWYAKNGIEKVEVRTMDIGTKMTACEVEQIMKLKGVGKSDNEIAKELNRSQSTVSKSGPPLQVVV